MRRNIIKRGYVVPRWLKSDKVHRDRKRNCGVIGNIRRYQASSYSDSEESNGR